MSLTQTRIRDLGIFNPETNPTPIDQLLMVVDHPSFGKPLSILYPFARTESNEFLGADLVQSSGWTSTGWTGDESVGWTHTTGNTNVLSSSLSSLVDSSYQIQVIMSGRTEGSVIVTFGGDTSPAMISSSYYSIKSTEIEGLEITPTSDFNGTIRIIVKEIVWVYTKEQLLEVLEVADLYSQDEIDVFLSGKVSNEDGKALILSTEITRLANIKQNIYTISLPASSNVSGRISGATVPSDWTVEVGESSLDLLITHTLDRRVANVSIFAVDDDEETFMPMPSGFTGLKSPDSDTILIMGLTKVSVELKIYVTLA